MRFRSRRGVAAMDRRAFIGRVAGGFVAAPLGAEAQQGGKVYAVDT
jgi:hypothetical protein